MPFLSLFHNVVEVLMAIAPIFMHDKSMRGIFCDPSNNATQDYTQICSDGGWIYKNVQQDVWETGWPFSYWKIKNAPHFFLAGCTCYFIFEGLHVWCGVFWGRVRSKVELSQHESVPRYLLNAAFDSTGKPKPYLQTLKYYSKFVSLCCSLLLPTSPAERPSTLNSDAKGIRHEDSLTSHEFWALMDEQPFASPSLSIHMISMLFLTLLVMVMAHVNIVTRIVASHCMSFYWLLAGRITAGVSDLQLVFDDPTNHTRAMCSYLLMFNVVG
eukprot:CAMPEP_0182514730 /NCGR_PEP_ID=MMETSP1321-20130603/36391_1 /TAXON_ID=91990 /ORGANISM="Bolidomonas sp., Strain RCC1657" /LENGTH=269 /DNA_ID=CAMNT_0024721991 /DNA_START=127 /DNA_END=932 /DNA_ORIENTATION=-